MRQLLKAGGKLRWRIACRLNRNPDACWSHLVDWALDQHQPNCEPYRLRDRFDRWTCNTDIERHGSCYCGKKSRPLDHVTGAPVSYDMADWSIRESRET